MAPATIESGMGVRRSKTRAPVHSNPYPNIIRAFAAWIDQTSEMTPRPPNRAVAGANTMKAAPHQASAMVLLACSQANKRRVPPSAMLKTVTAKSVAISSVTEQS